MNIITKQMLADNIAQRWYWRFADTVWWREVENDKRYNKKATHDALVALGEHPSPDDIAKVIGNDFWTDLTCEECCKSRLDCAIEVGGMLDSVAKTACICLDCADKITALAAEARGK